MSRGVGRDIVTHRHVDDKSFRGEVGRYGLEHRWKDTTIGGYRPNASSTCERRIGMLHQMFRVLILVATILVVECTMGNCGVQAFVMPAGLLIIGCGLIERHQSRDCQANL